MSIRKCSIGVTRWSFFRPRSVNFPGRHQLAFFSISIGESSFFRGGLMESLPSKWKHAGIGRTTTTVELERKNLADLHCKFLLQHRSKKHHLLSKNIIGLRLFKKLRNVDWKILFAASQRPMSAAIVFSIQSLNNIWMMSIKKYYWPPFVKKTAQCRLNNISRGFTTTDVGYCIFYAIP